MASPRKPKNELALQESAAPMAADSSADKSEKELVVRQPAAPIAADSSADKSKNELALHKPGTPLNRMNRAPSPLPEPPRRLKKIKVPKPDMAQAELEDRLTRASGTRNADFLNGILSQVISAGELGRETDDREIDFLLSVVEDIEPRNVIEGMLAAQMATLHVQSMRLVRYLNRLSDDQTLQTVGGLLIKMNKTFAAQAETLSRLRTGGAQNLTVGHVSVGEGGQAIVGNIMSPSSDPVGTRVSEASSGDEEEPSHEEGRDLK